MKSKTIIFVSILAFLAAIFLSSFKEDKEYVDTGAQKNDESIDLFKRVPADW